MFYNLQYLNLILLEIHEFLSCLTGTKSSVGWACNKVKALAEGLTVEEAIKKIKTRLLQEPVVVCDETGARAEAKNAWVHTVSTPEISYQIASTWRGVKGMIEGDFLPHFKGAVVHDCWSPYWSDLLTDPSRNEQTSGVLLHALCNQHLIRELRWVFEHGSFNECEDQAWDPGFKF